VIATQNPIEQEGTYPLPEAQLDRFMMKLDITYPSQNDEIRMLRDTTSPSPASVSQILSREDILQLQEMTRAVPVADDIYELAVRAVRSTRPDSPDAVESVKSYVQWGASPRACQYIILAAKAHALMHGNVCVDREDVTHVIMPVISHRILLNYHARAEDIHVESVVHEIIEKRMS
jgi:MoxR-like ATPase